MKPKSLIGVMALLLCLIFTACSDDIPECATETESSDSAAFATLTFFKDYSGKSRSDNKELIIDNISRVSYYHDGISLMEYTETESRSNSHQSEFDLATVSFHIDSIHGFSVVCEKEGFNEVIHFTTGLKITEVDKIEPLAEIFKNLPQIVYHKFNQTDLTSRDDDFVHVDCTDLISINSPFFNQSWDQMLVNLRAPECSCLSDNGHQPIGCVALAVGLAIIKTKHFRPSFPENYGIDLSEIESLNRSSRIWREKASNFFFEVAEGCQTIFKCGGSSSSIGYASRYLITQGYFCFNENVDYDFDYKRVQRNLQKGFVTLCTGKSKYNSPTGHMWVLDGIRYISDTNPEIWHQYHQIWGGECCQTWSVFYNFGDSDLSYQWDNHCIYIDDLLENLPE